MPPPPPSSAAVDGVGYAGTALLAVVYVPQVWRSVRDPAASLAVSPWTLGLQLASNACFVAYAAMLRQWPVLVASACVVAGSAAVLCIRGAAVAPQAAAPSRAGPGDGHGSHGPVAAVIGGHKQSPEGLV